MSAPAGGPAWPELPAHIRARAGGPAGDADGAAARVLAGALRWLEQQREWFAPERWEEFLPPRPFRAGPLVELLGLVRVSARAGLPAGGAGRLAEGGAGRLAEGAGLPSCALDLAERAARAGDFAAGLRRADELFPYHLNLVGLLELLGRPQPVLRGVCEALIAADAGGHARAYKPALNRIELRYFLDRGGFRAPAHLPGLAALCRQSIAAQQPDVLQLTQSETYALTHVLFYATDFGRHRRCLPAGEAAERLAGSVRTLLGVHLARGSLDLLAELLLCDTAVAGVRPDDALVARGWHALATAQRPDGAVPSPVHRPGVLAGLAGEKAAAYLFGTCYHTTLAAALAAVVRIAASQTAAGQNPPARTAVSTRDRPTAPAPAPDRPTARAQAPAPAPAAPLPVAEPGAIRRWAAGVEADGAAGPADRAHLEPLLVLAVQAHDPTVLADVLGAAERLGDGDRPLVRRAAALLAAWA
ncbi:hypothetical protein QIS99_21165 [Streptomyces sp. B-S-A8]|uniref:DUF6895 domain-containing protein n=1 Tax=Streptomyces solicavernae TaxID=3043614 RepID=A0ABT6RW71_9ACTN|nr:hypothetical protein [Streptomyces sp. B-S-A8]MDI3388696.1 hypothetical protein [Streptomyces sp. B-S-A8]